MRLRRESEASPMEEKLSALREKYRTQTGWPKAIKRSHTELQAQTELLAEILEELRKLRAGGEG